MYYGIYENLFLQTESQLESKKNKKIKNKKKEKKPKCERWAKNQII